MELTHNGDPVAEPLADGATVADAIERCTRGGRVLTRVRLDGCEIPLDDLAEVSALELGGIGALALESRAERELALDALESCADYAQAVAAALERSAGLLRDGAGARANALLADALDALAVLASTLGRAARLLGEDGAGLAEPIAALDAWLAPLAERHEHGDWIGVADLLEYELAPCVAALRAGSAAARERALAARS